MQRISLEPGKHAYTMGQIYPPIATVKPGETFMVETQDGPDGTIKSEQDRPSEKLNFEHANPETGPILVGERDQEIRSLWRSRTFSRSANMP